MPFRVILWLPHLHEKHWLSSWSHTWYLLRLDFLACRFWYKTNKQIVASLFVTSEVVTTSWILRGLISNNLRFVMLIQYKTVMVANILSCKQIRNGLMIFLLQFLRNSVYEFTVDVPFNEFRDELACSNQAFKRWAWLLFFATFLPFLTENIFLAAVNRIWHFCMSI